MNERQETRSLLVGYLLWIFGFFGAHRFYFGKRVSGTIWFFTLGLFLIGWLIDLFLIPGMERQAERRYVAGPVNYSVAWVLLTFLGPLGMHRFYQGKIFTGLLYLAASGVFFTFPLSGVIIVVGILYDYFTLNQQVSDLNAER